MLLLLIQRGTKQSTIYQDLFISELNHRTWDVNSPVTVVVLMSFMKKKSYLVFVRNDRLIKEHVELIIVDRLLVYYEENSFLECWKLPLT